MSAWFILAALNGAIAVAAGVLEAHGLRGRLDAEALEIFGIGARYQMYHALALGLAALAMKGEAAPRARIAAWLFVVGLLLFCGSLYFLALTGVRAAGYVTPFGGIAFLGGWLALIWAGLKLRS
ncbi:MAG: DUF423 domain-containing protein [Alphaproteobacteria bacterium]|nr:DUF423 domain-containing protein [Alphaproteobacteria bacterium]